MQFRPTSVQAGCRTDLLQILYERYIKNIWILAKDYTHYIIYIEESWHKLLKPDTQALKQRPAGCLPNRYNNIAN